MRTAALLAVSALPGACSGLPSGLPGVTEEYAMDVTSVTVPATVPAGAPLDVDVEVTVRGCSRFARLDATRTPSRLTLRAVGIRTLNVPCTADIGWEHRVYTDPGTPARVGSFEVVVNGTGSGPLPIQ